MPKCKKTQPLLFVIFAAIAWYCIFKRSSGTGRVKLTVYNDIPSYSSITELVDHADYIVVGEYTSYDAAWNMARNPEDASEENENVYIEGHLYTFQIEFVLNGDIDEDEIIVNLRYADRFGLNEDDTVLVPDLNYVEPELGTTYVLFLEKEESEDYQGYYGIGTPFAIKLGEDGFAEIDRNLDKKSILKSRSSNNRIVIVEYGCSNAWINEFADSVAVMKNETVLDRIKDRLQ